jgi:hypothetical protein
LLIETLARIIPTVFSKAFLVGRKNFLEIGCPGFHQPDMKYKILHSITHLDESSFNPLTQTALFRDAIPLKFRQTPS